MRTKKFGLVPRLLYGILALTFAVSCGRSQGGAGADGNQGSALPSAQPSVQQTMTGNTLSDVAERTIDSVVNISSSKTIKVSPGGSGSPFFDDPFFRFFFNPQGRSDRPITRRENALGSGVIVSADGIILTNNHMVQGADKLTVILRDKRQFEAEVVGADPPSDVAVIRLKKKADNLKPIPFGDSDALRLAEVVLAIGNPFGLDHTVTMGIVSAKGRNNIGITDYEDFIQTDAAINPGNSGGALINLRGQLVGINTAIVSNTGQYNGIGFAIPSNMAKSVMEILVKGKKIVRGWLGVGIQEITSDMAEAMGMKKPGGVLISEVSKDSPASKAGLKSGDVILSVNGKETNSPGELMSTIALLGPDKKVTLRILRGGKEQNIEAKLAERPANPRAALSSGKQEKSSLDGFEVSSLTPELRNAFHIPGEIVAGVVITAVEEGGAADEAGLKPGDVILKIDNRVADSVDTFVSAYKKAKNKTLLYIWRDGAYMFRVLRKER
jgi:serine protease Do